MRRSDARGGFYRGEPQNFFKRKVNNPGIRYLVLGTTYLAPGTRYPVPD